MNSEWFMAQLQALRVLPLVLLDHPSSGVGVAHALASAGLTCIEVSLRTEGAVEALREIVRAVPDMLVGAGTVMRPEQVDVAAAAGAHFVGSPVIDRLVIERARRMGVPIIPGVERPTDAIAAARVGAQVVRLKSDGSDELGAFARMFPGLRFMPAGPILPDEIAGYLHEPSVLAVASTRLTPYGAPPAEIRQLAHRAARAAASVGPTVKR